MSLNKYDQTLKLIAQNNLLSEMPESNMDGDVLEFLIQESLIRKNGQNCFELTSYGEIIQIMGYEAHQKKKVKSELSRKRKIDCKIFYFLVLLLVITLLMILLLWSAINE